MGKTMDRFWNKVSKSDDCWEWLAHKNPKGYGKFRYAGANGCLAHRVSWELEYGDIPDGMHVLHRCDNPSCVRPDHLFLGTNKDNVEDRVSKGRQRSHVGTNNPRAILTPDQVRYIRYSSATADNLAAVFNVKASYIPHIKSRKVWRNVV